MNQSGLFDAPPSPRPPVTRWWFEWTPEWGTQLTRMVETGEVGDPECPMPVPRRPEHDEWLSPDGIGMTTTWGGGAVGWIEGATTRRPPRKGKW